MIQYLFIGWASGAVCGFATWVFANRADFSAADDEDVPLTFLGLLVAALWPVWIAVVVPTWLACRAGRLLNTWWPQ